MSDRPPTEITFSTRHQISLNCVSAVGFTAVVSLAVVIVLACVVFIKPSVNKKVLASRNSTRICTSAECIAAGKYFESNLNSSADPCNDFFNYVCGGWLERYKQHNIEDVWDVYRITERDITEVILKMLKSNETSTSSTVNKAKKLFQRGLQANSLQELRAYKEIAKEFGGFPLFEGAAYVREVSWYDRFARATRELSTYDIDDGFSLGVLINFVIKPRKSLAIISPQRWLFKKASFYASSNFQDAILNVICNIMRSPCTKVTRTQISEQSRALGRLFSNLSKCVAGNENSSEELSMAVFEERYPSLHLFDFLKAVFVNSNSKIQADTQIEFDPLFVKNISEIVKSTPKDVLDNLIGFYVVDKLFTSMSQEYREIRKTLFDVSDDSLDPAEKWYYQQIEYPFRMAISRLLVDRYFEWETMDTLRKIEKNMRKSFVKIVYSKLWLDTYAKKIAIEKINMMDIKIGFPKWIKNNADLDSFHYYHRDMVDNESVILNLRKAFTFATGEQLMKFGYPNYKAHEWDLPPHAVNAVNDNEKNTVTFPLGQYIQPFYWPSTTKALSYSGAAYILAHEMARTLDKIAIGNDAYGNRFDWMSNKSRAVFQHLSDCIFNQYSAITDQLRGEEDLINDVADNAAIRVAYGAYQLAGAEDKRLPGIEDLDDKKLFFIGTAMNWCSHDFVKEVKNEVNGNLFPNVHRAWLPLSNFDEFAKVFNCSVESKMNRKNKCVLW